ncbi:MAG: PAS domain-containing protein [candidate division Zixibacteria bacterium]|nr:PAS domain-containing protein [candidate division Zixibacteria bacterium]
MHESTQRIIGNPRHQLEYIINFLPDPTFAVDFKGIVIAWNHAMEKLSGIPAKEILGEGDYAYAVPYYGIKRPILLDLIIQKDNKLEKLYPSITRDNDTLIVEVFAPAVKPSGKYLWVKASPLYDSQGKVVGAIEATRDITEIKKSQQALNAMYEKLKEERSALHEKNIALREILGHIEEEKLQISRQMKANIERVVMPVIKTLREKVKDNDREYFSLLENCLKDITAPFVNKLESRFSKLSPREIEICNMVKNGHSSKDIATALSISVHTVIKQRQRIRSKLGITNGSINLTSYLMTF